MEAARANSHYFRRKLHSLLGVIPVGGFLIMHLMFNYQAWVGGAEAYNNVVATIAKLPFLPILEWGLIFIPLYAHAIYGIFIALDAKHNVGRYRYERNWAFFMQRFTGLFTLIFVTYHIFQFSMRKIFLGTEINFALVQAGLANNFIFVFYLLGVTAAAYHLANGLWSFLIVWGITVGPRSQKISRYLSYGVFAAISAIGIFAAFAFRV